MASKKFDSFVNENKHSNLNLKELEPKDLTETIQHVKPGDTYLLRCHWAVSEYAVPRICKAVFNDKFDTEAYREQKIQEEMEKLRK